MNRTIITVAAALIAATASVGAQAQQADSGYDYASKFYPHPAWLYLRSEAPREMGQHPAVLVARRAAAGERTVAEANEAIYPHPAWGYLALEEPHRMNAHPAVIVAERARAEHEAAAPTQLAQR